VAAVTTRDIQHRDTNAQHSSQPSLRKRHVLRKFHDSQVRWSRAVERLLPAHLTQDGYRDFSERLVPAFLAPGQPVFDIGGGKRPYVTPALKAQLGLKVVGVDISQQELDRAPEGIYDAKTCGNIATLRGDSDADLLICLAVLEHVRDVRGAFAAIASFLKPGARALVFVPSRNALFARLNLLVPERLKRAILYFVYPQSRGHQGFPSYYDHCTPAAFEKLARESGMVVEHEQLYFVSTYFFAFFPAYLIWRLAKQVVYVFSRRAAAETFAVVLRKQP
jgi:2-polyprenyl-6-hydroxyphenyl methylase/3-demethylubiquinone-9 3-methyltransferase